MSKSVNNESIRKNSIFKAMVKGSSNSKKSSKGISPKQFDSSILYDGGESVFQADIDGKLKAVMISVHSSTRTMTPKYKFKFVNAMGNSVYIKAVSLKLAQEVANQLIGEKGKYRVSSALA